MKTLLLFRHGKSDWDAVYDHDHERPLARRGRKAARRMGRFLAHSGNVPDLVFTSTAVRAQETWRQARKAGAFDPPVRAAEALYEAGPEDVLRVVREAPDAVEVLMVVGHEPGWSETVHLLTGGAVRFPTAAVARVDLDVPTWRGAAAGAGQLHWLVPPRLLKQKAKGA